MIKSIAFTMYPAADLARARDFYERLLGLHPSREFGSAWIEYDLENGTFALTTMAESRIPGADAGGAMAVVLDSEGNALTLHQAKTA